MIYIHLLIWVGFGLIGYVPNSKIFVCLFIYSEQHVRLYKTDNFLQLAIKVKMAMIEN
jgi:hypothetical protein